MVSSSQQDSDVRISGGLRILVVDDIQANTDSLAMVFEAWGHHTGKACCGEEALEQFASFKPHVVLMDLLMTGMNGFTTAREMRNRFKEHKFSLVAMSGWIRRDIPRQLVDAGFDAHLTKPTNLDDLKRIFAQVENGDYSLANFPIQ
jgi:two-component system, OmpR family, response regulator